MISLCMIVKDEEKFLKDCLDSIKSMVSEIIIVDTGSKDKTVEIAKSYTNKIYFFKWINDFSAARNFSISKAAQPWILILDADETISSEDIEKIKELIKNQTVAAYSLMQRNYTNNISLLNFIPESHKDFKGYIPCNIIRLFKNDKRIQFTGVVHEYVDESIKSFNGKIVKTGIPIHHYEACKGEDKIKEKQLNYLKIYEKNIDSYPNKARAYRDIGILYYEYVKDYKKAIENLNISLKYSKNIKTFIALGWCYIKLDDYESAIKEFNTALSLYPNNYTLLISLANSYMKNRQDDEAIRYFENALCINKKDEAALREIINSLKNNSNYKLTINLG